MQAEYFEDGGIWTYVISLCRKTVKYLEVVVLIKIMLVPNFFICCIFPAIKFHCFTFSPGKHQTMTKTLLNLP